MRDSSYQSSYRNTHQSTVQGGEKKVMKKSLSLLVAIALVFSMFSSVAFAATTSAGQKLQDLGIIKGDQKGNLLEDQNWKRQDVAVLLSRLMGKEPEAKNTAKSHTYADVRGTYYDGYLSWARENGYMQGHSATKFGFDDPITLKEFATVILRVLGYDTSDYTKIEELAVEVGLVEEGTDFSADAKRGETYDIIVIALDTEVAGTGKKLGTILGLPGYEVVDPAVTGATALNLKQVKVTFNKEVDKASAEKLSNYKVYNSGATTDLVANGSIALQSDKSSVVITLGGQLNNGQQDAKIVVEGVKDTEGRVIEKYEATFQVVDNTVPTVVGVKVVGPRDIEVEFSEPVVYKDTGVNKTEDFQVDDGSYFVVDVNLNVNKAKVTTGLDMTEGEHTIKLTGKHLSDYAGFKPVPVTITFTLVKDTTAPVASVLSVTPTEVKIGFNKPVVGFQDSNVRIRHTYDNNTYEVQGDSSAVTANDTDTEFTIDFTGKPIPIGSNRIYISYNDPTNGPFIRDLWGNKFEAAVLEINVSLDTEKPTVSEVKFVDPQTLEVVFSKTVEKDSAQNLDNYTVKDSAGNKIEVLDAILDSTNTKVTLKFDTNALGGGSYTIEVKGVKDRALVPNIMDAVTITLAVNDTVKPTVQDAVYVADAANGKVKVLIPFSEQMKASTLVKSNFQKNMDGSGFVTLGDNDSIKIGADAKSVILELDGYDPTKPFSIRIGAVTDLAGNGLETFVAVSGDNFKLEEDNFAIEEVQAIGKRQIKVVFNGKFSSIDKSDFTVEAGDTKLTITSIASTNSDRTEVVFNLSGAEINTQGKVGSDDVKVTVTPSTSGETKTKSFLGKPLAAQIAVAADKIAPEVVKVSFVDDKHIRIEFSENLDGSKFSTAGVNGFSVAGGGASLNKATLVSDNVVELEGSNFKKNITLVSYNDAAGITDIPGNKLASFSNKKAE